MTRQELRNDLSALEQANLAATRAWAAGDKATYALRDAERTALASRIRAGAVIDPERLIEFVVQSYKADIGESAPRLDTVRTELRSAQLR